MPFLPVFLIFISCFMHAGWNLLARRQRRELVFFRHLLILCLPLAAVAIGVGLCFPHSLPPKALGCVAASGVICGFYYWFLGLAYRSSDFTVVYPVARALPVLIVAGIDLLRGHYPSSTGVIGMSLVVGGCMLAPQASYAGFSIRRYGGRDVWFMALTAGTIVGFTMFDKIAAETVRPGPASAAIYCGLFHILTLVSYFGIYALFAKERGGREEVGWKWPGVGAVLSLGGYFLVLWAFQLAPQTGYLLALRQFSIVIGVVAAFKMYGERGLAVRIPATAATVAGLALLVLYG